MIAMSSSMCVTRLHVQTKLTMIGYMAASIRWGRLLGAFEILLLQLLILSFFNAADKW